MLKLNRFRQSTDLSLHRSVMICNTLRMLEKELERDGLKVNVSPNEIFDDIDLSLYDFDLISPLSPPSNLVITVEFDLILH
ncbi:hypothetical protein DERP_003037 [Dermatophagoides pteronyssinus]|uniref:SERTA domain-containing protein n=1 Tax=Dermatophagoides pteronyssinus TaxID=6956 RepID=A0ABQ8JIC0_DERPT|nr:hypothetical protein DERP_003037 [Dermatophagoides pteronyssinus]